MSHTPSETELAQRLEEYRQKIRSIVEKHGWAVQGVMYDSPLQYTVGITQKYDHPELVVRGLPMDTGQQILNDLGKRVSRGENFKAGKLYHDIFRGYPAKFIAISDPVATRELKVAREYAQEGIVQALQLLWPDQNGVFPDAPTASEKFKDSQPLLG